MRIAESQGLDKFVARMEARVLAAFTWGVAPSWLIAHDTDSLNPEQIARFYAVLARRLEGEPIAYITGYREFYGREFNVSPDVLIPRPETELLVELALARIPIGQSIQVLDLGTGSGCIAISLALERPQACITTIDCSAAALAIARLNKKKWNANLTLLESDWFSALGNLKFDLIVGNPPYVAEDDPHLSSGDVRYEPASALRSGKEGMGALSHIIREACTFLNISGCLLLEHGHNQRLPVQNAFHLSGFGETTTRQDLAGKDRVTSGIWRSGIWRRNSLHLYEPS